MPGSISAVLTQGGQSVRQGEALLVIEAMKMQAQIAAPRDRVVKAVLVRPGEQVDANAKISRGDPEFP